ncbi:hypothetical protein E3Q22_03182 [Wallemia mellicola]|uniref:Stress-response A/B barrel domain-containing protein n=1 Tax=Wallemia mellicola TaxID=1708541 RepID=A0A4T0SUI4_9BASI|nr:hypothetical protein E3Q24_02938 [Wallemia mellicola]TIB75553.1 hypothetical protein E3Q23_02310 [Wallemia mellicola]TIB77128.1 hypothetical protein E3Q22_03182 [Wallemia mellicola]TIB83014.1 hypothetical protein E3Q21_03130 [Wallemia mellicola]TIB85740.1 hypothetical protein E3Q20_03122 [Wallemia mellicola]
MITHVVAFKYKTTVNADLRKEIAHRLLALGDTSGVIRSVTGGLEQSPEGKGKGFHQVFVMKFNLWEDLQFCDLTEDVQVWDFQDFEF